MCYITLCKTTRFYLKDQVIRSEELLTRNEIIRALEFNKRSGLKRERCLPAYAIAKHYKTYERARSS